MTYLIQNQKNGLYKAEGGFTADPMEALRFREWSDARHASGDDENPLQPIPSFLFIEMAESLQFCITYQPADEYDDGFSKEYIRDEFDEMTNYRPPLFVDHSDGSYMPWEGSREQARVDAIIAQVREFLK